MTCEICQLPEGDHPAYAAGIGSHDYQFPVTGPFPVSDLDRLARERREAGLDEGGQPLPTPSDRLPWTDRLPRERYSTGRVPLPPAPEESYPPDAVDLPVEYADDLDVIAQANPSLGRRVEPNAFRRILNAARRNT